MVRAEKNSCSENRTRDRGCKRRQRAAPRRLLLLRASFFVRHSRGPLMNHPFSRLAAQCLNVDCRTSRKRASRPLSLVTLGRRKSSVSRVLTRTITRPQIHRGTPRRNSQNGCCCCCCCEIHVVFTKPVNELLSATGRESVREENGI